MFSIWGCKTPILTELLISEQMNTQDNSEVKIQFFRMVILFITLFSMINSPPFQSN